MGREKTRKTGILVVEVLGDACVSALCAASLMPLVRTITISSNVSQQTDDATGAVILGILAAYSGYCAVQRGKDLISAFRKERRVETADEKHKK